jgi:hypothetical protein
VARAREMAQMAAAGGADAPFGVSCTPAARLCQKRQKDVGGSFRVYQFLIEEKVADLLFFSPPRENGGGCTPSA